MAPKWYKITRSWIPLVIPRPNWDGSNVWYASITFSVCQSVRTAVDDNFDKRYIIFLSVSFAPTDVTVMTKLGISRIECTKTYHKESCTRAVSLESAHDTGDDQRAMHYRDVIIGSMSSQITSLTIVYLAVYSGADQRKHIIMWDRNVVMHIAFYPPLGNVYGTIWA